MGLIDRLQAPLEERQTVSQPSLFNSEQRPSSIATADSGKELFEDLKYRVQQRLLQKIDVSRLEEAGYGALLVELGTVIDDLIREDGLLLTEADRNRLVEVTTNDMLGLGPLEPLLQDNTISDIIDNGHSDVWVERGGQLFRTDIRFNDDRQLMRVINRIVSRVGRRIDESSPMVDARLRDGSRVNAVIPPLALDGPTVSIRRFGTNPLKLEDLLNYKTFTPEMAMLMEAAIKARLNIIISGGTGCGKTTLLNTLSAFIPSDDRIVTIEDAAELQLQQEHVVRLETRPSNIEGKGEVATRDLVRNSLRMRPDRIVIGECRGSEALVLLEAVNT